MGASIDYALVTKGRGRSKSRGPKGKGKGNNISRSKGRATCSKFRKLGHTKKCCNSKKLGQSDNKNQKKANNKNTTVIISHDCLNDDVVA